MSEPRTETGQALARADTPYGYRVWRRQDILLIEAEAAALERERLRALAEAWTSEPNRVFDRIFLRRLLDEPTP